MPRDRHQRNRKPRSCVVGHPPLLTGTITTGGQAPQPSPTFLSAFIPLTTRVPYRCLVTLATQHFLSLLPAGSGEPGLGPGLPPTACPLCVSGARAWVLEGLDGRGRVGRCEDDWRDEQKPFGGLPNSAGGPVLMRGPRSLALRCL